MIVDPVWALAEARALEPGSAREIRAHYFGSAIGLFVAWSVFIVTGVMLGSRLDSHALGVAAPLCLLWLVVSRLNDPRNRFIVAAAATGALVGRTLAVGLAIFVAILAGCIAGQRSIGASVMIAWIVVICIGIGSLAFRAARARRSLDPAADEPLDQGRGVAATAAITVASFDRAAQSGDVAALAVAGIVGFVLALRGASMLRVVAVGAGLFIVVSLIL
jgi:hypothetical protein